MKKFKQKFAFTAAETLLAMLIIGIVIAISFPTLFLSYRKSTTVTILKDTYSELNSAITNLSLSKGCAGNLVCKDLLSNFTNYLSSQYQINKTCIAPNDNCWNNRVYQYINRDVNHIRNYNEVGNNFIDAKNRIFNIEIIDTTCSTDLSANVSPGDTVPPKHKLKNVCGFITVDIDGNKNTNIYGIDVFKFILTNTRNSYLYPFGGKYHNQYWKGAETESCQPENNLFNGETCAGRIMDENWKINYFDK